MANHSSVLAWKIPWTERPGGLQSIGSQRVGRNLAHMHTPKCLIIHHTKIILSERKKCCVWEIVVLPSLVCGRSEWNAHFICRKSARILDRSFQIIWIAFILKNSKQSSALETQKNLTKQKKKKKKKKIKCTLPLENHFIQFCLVFSFHLLKTNLL